MLLYGSGYHVGMTRFPYMPIMDTIPHWCVSIICNSYILRWGSWDQRTRAGTGLLIIDTLVPVVGVEPTRCYHHEILSLARLPIPSHRHISNPSWTPLFLKRMPIKAALFVMGYDKQGPRGRSSDIDNFGFTIPFLEYDNVIIPRCHILGARPPR